MPLTFTTHDRPVAVNSTVALPVAVVVTGGTSLAPVNVATKRSTVGPSSSLHATAPNTAAPATSTTISFRTFIPASLVLERWLRLSYQDAARSDTRTSHCDRKRARTSCLLRTVGTPRRQYPTSKCVRPNLR